MHIQFCSTFSRNLHIGILLILVAWFSYSAVKLFQPQEAQARGSLSFALPSKSWHIGLPGLSKATGKPHEALAMACGGEAKCICINTAIFKHDSSYGTKGTAAKTHVPCNMRIPSRWTPSVGKPKAYKSPGNGYFAMYDTLQEGITACVELYQRNYSSLPPAQLVSRWTGAGGNANYRAAVSNCYL